MSDGAWDLFQSLVRADAIEVAVDDGPLRERMRRAARELEARTSLRLALVDPAAPRSARPRVVVGDWNTHGVRDLAQALGVEELEDGGFGFGRRVYDEPGDALVAWFEDPERRGVATGLYLAARAEYLLGIVEDLTPPARMSVVCYSEGDPFFHARLAPDGEILWESARDLFSAWSSFTEGMRKISDRRCAVFAPPEVDDRTIVRYLDRVAAARTALEAWFQDEGPPPPGATIYAYGHAEDKLRFSLDPSLATASASRTVHALLADGVPDDGGASAVRVELHARLGPPSAAWIDEAIPVAAAGSWWGADLESHVAHLARSGRAPSVARLVDPAADRRLSPHVRAPLRAALFAWLAARELEAGDRDFASALWRGETEVVPDATLEEDFRAELERKAQRAPTHAAREPNTDFWKGIALEPAGEGDLGGYAAREVSLSLARARAAGADAVLLSTAAFLDPGWPETPDAALGRRRVATQSDLALAQAVAAAHALSLRVALAPHLLTSPSGTFAGNATWTSRASWRGFFENYARFLDHYALLAELVGADLLCMGAELGAASSFQPEARRVNVDHALLAMKRESWEEWIVGVRALFGGSVTYSVRSSTGANVGRFALWDRLDFVSSAFFESVPDHWRSRRALALGMESRIDELVLAAGTPGTPLLLFPVGFPSSVGGGLRPSVPGEKPDPERQRELFAGLADAVSAARERGVLGGVFVWSWSTDPDGGGLADPGYSPQHKPAEALLPELFGD